MRDTTHYLTPDKIKVAAQWWTDLLRSHQELYDTASRAGVTIVGLAPVSVAQINRFETALEHEMRTMPRWGIARLLFVNYRRPCDELTKAAGIASIYNRLPHHTVMQIYPQRVIVSRGDGTRRVVSPLWVREQTANAAFELSGRANSFALASQTSSSSPPSMPLKVSSN